MIKGTNISYHLINQKSLDEFLSKYVVDSEELTYNDIICSFNIAGLNYDELWCSYFEDDRSSHPSFSMLYVYNTNTFVYIDGENDIAYRLNSTHKPCEFIKLMFDHFGIDWNKI